MHISGKHPSRASILYAAAKDARANGEQRGGDRITALSLEGSAIESGVHCMLIDAPALAMSPCSSVLIKPHVPGTSPHKPDHLTDYGLSRATRDNPQHAANTP